MGEIEAHYEPMTSANIEQPVEDRTGTLSRVREMAVNAWDTATRHPKELLAIGAASFACAQAAELSLGSDPVSADTGSCISKLEQPPYNISSVMLVPKKTEVRTVGQLEGVEGCDSYERKSEYKLELDQNGVWTPVEGNFWYPTDASTHGKDKNDAHSFGLLDFATDNIQEKKVNGHWEAARILFVNFVKNRATGKIIGQGKIKDQPVQIP